MTKQVDYIVERRDQAVSASEARELPVVSSPQDTQQCVQDASSLAAHLQQPQPYFQHPVQRRLEPKPVLELLAFRQSMTWNFQPRLHPSPPQLPQSVATTSRPAEYRKSPRPRTCRRCQRVGCKGSQNAALCPINPK